MIRLIRKWLKAGVMEDGEWSSGEAGTPQGAVVSPTLANIYLHYSFDLWAERWRHDEARGNVSTCATPTISSPVSSTRVMPCGSWRIYVSGWRSLRYRCIRTRRA